mmetsp:Transcript_19440/g.61952  ORF Transcript_19440/g.61952 Transcript_19440/m.61952 type:complete len:367 (+) Transcript_19440:849-1949(+)
MRELRPPDRAHAARRERVHPRPHRPHARDAGDGAARVGARRGAAGRGEGGCGRGGERERRGASQVRLRRGVARRLQVRRVRQKDGRDGRQADRQEEFPRGRASRAYPRHQALQRRPLREGQQACHLRRGARPRPLRRACPPREGGRHRRAGRARRQQDARPVEGAPASERRAGAVPLHTHRSGRPLGRDELGQRRPLHRLCQVGRPVVPRRRRGGHKVELGVRIKGDRLHALLPPPPRRARPARRPRRRCGGRRSCLGSLLLRRSRRLQLNRRRRAHAPGLAPAFRFGGGRGGGQRCGERRRGRRLLRGEEGGRSRRGRCRHERRRCGRGRCRRGRCGRGCGRRRGRQLRAGAVPLHLTASRQLQV